MFGPIHKSDCHYVNQCVQLYSKMIKLAKFIASDNRLVAIYPCITAHNGAQYEPCSNGSDKVIEHLNSASRMVAWWFYLLSALMRMIDAWKWHVHGSICMCGGTCDNLNCWNVTHTKPPNSLPSGIVNTCNIHVPTTATCNTNIGATIIHILVNSCGPMVIHCCYLLPRHIFWCLKIDKIQKITSQSILMPMW